jgi:hypothetical protein
MENGRGEKRRVFNHRFHGLTWIRKEIEPRREKEREDFWTELTE